MFNKVLIANRGEIAVRIMRACREMGVGSVAVCSEADAAALHTRYADESYLIGPGPAPQSYLSAERIIDAARRAKAEAVHPGYGFLAERADFAQACIDAGLAFIGPPPKAIAALGDKVTARQIARAAGAPTVPGTETTVDYDEATAIAAEIGYPVLIKAAAGGGGRGIRVVQDPESLAWALQVAASEAEAAFGNAGVYVEKYLDPVRHVEVQVLADQHGAIVHLGERECSVQRRNQKLVEESPSPAVSPELRAELGRTAIAISHAAGYQNAGTVEFLLDGAGNFYFIEVNARLQVEHPVTELVTGIDVVKEQLRLAAGEPLGYTQDDIRFRGWAMECRITAEDPAQGFMPNIGRVEYVSEPSGPGVRIDSSLFSGYQIPQFYDSMLSKAIAWGATREEAVARLSRALDEYVIVGPRTTIPFHKQLLRHEEFLNGQMHTRFVDTRFRFQSDAGGSEDVALLVAAALSHSAQSERRPGPGRSSNNGPSVSGWKMAGRVAAMSTPTGGGSWRNSS